MVDATALHETMEISAGELGSVISPKAEWYPHFSEEFGEHLDGSRRCGVCSARDNHESAREF